MKDQLQQALVSIIVQATQTLSDGITFLKGQVPDVVHQVLMWELVSNLIGAVVFFSLFAGTAYWLVRFCRAENKKPHGDAGPAILGLIPLLGEAFFGTVFFMAFLKVWIAPKLFLIEYASHLLK